MNIRMKRGAALALTAALLLAGSAQALFGLGKGKTETPVSENAPAVRDLEIRTYRGIPYQGQLEGTDPDGGELTFAIDVQPKKGTVTVEGASFTYTPRDNALGADSFTYTAANSAGAVSQSATVTVTIEKTRSGVTSHRRPGPGRAGGVHRGEDRREVVFRAGPDRQPGGVPGHGAGNCRDRCDGGHQDRLLRR